MPVEIGDPLGHFRCHFRTQWGRKPLYTTNIHRVCDIRDFEKILCLCVEFLSNLVFVESHRLLDHDRYELTDIVKQRTEDMSRGPPIDFFLISRLNTLITPN